MTSKYFTKKYWNEPPTSFEFGIFVGGIVGSGITIIATFSLMFVMGFVK